MITKTPRPHIWPSDYFFPLKFQCPISQNSPMWLDILWYINILFVNYIYIFWLICRWYLLWQTSRWIWRCASQERDYHATRCCWPGVCHRWQNTLGQRLLFWWTSTRCVHMYLCKGRAGGVVVNHIAYRVQFPLCAVCANGFSIHACSRRFSPGSPVSSSLLKNWNIVLYVMLILGPLWK